MSLARYAKRRDANEREVITALRNAGAAVWQMDQPADLLCGLRGRLFTLEVKDGDKPESKRRLTPEEQAYLHTCRAMHLPHFVVSTIEEALQAAGL